VNQMFQLLKTYLCIHPREKVDIIGYSRGAASARIFANKVRRELPKAAIRFLGLFDTVAQLGRPNRYNYQYGHNLDIPKGIGFTAHAVAMNEYRLMFPLTSISKNYFQSKVLATFLGQVGVNAFDPAEFKEIIGLNYWEKPFEGAHSDIGGGNKEGRNLQALRWMIERGQAVGAPFSALEEYKFFDKLKNPENWEDSRWIIDIGQGDRAIYPGNL
jgi:hypothetical protein